MYKFKKIPTKDIKELPKTTGVYLFYSTNKIIYIGKAINIQSRVKNHFLQPSYRDNLFIQKIDKIGFLQTNSEIEALILEANLIKKHQPRFNVIWKDDKNYFYVAITKEKKPYVYITHQKNKDAEYIGPFVEGKSLKKTLRFLRRVFPYYTNKKHPKNKCTWCHLDLCPGPNPDLKEYKKNIKKLILILKGKRNAVLNSLKEEMKSFSKAKEFEKAKSARDTIYALEQVMANTSIINPPLITKSDNVWKATENIIQGILNTKKPISKIECYDISNMQGKQATGSMVVFINGVKDKNQYRKYKIKITDKPNDIAMIKETLERRFNHAEWKYPDLILIDGGIAQLNIAIKVKNKKTATKDIKVLSIAKRNNELYIEGKTKPVLLKSLGQGMFNLILQLRDEAHRFAITYHKKLRNKSLLDI